MRFRFGASLLFIVALLSAGSSFAAPSAIDQFGNIPLAFVKNEGQFDIDVEYVAYGNGCSMYFTKNGTRFVLCRETEASKDGYQELLRGEASKEDRDIYKHEFEEYEFTQKYTNSSPSFEIIGEDQLPWYGNFYLSNDQSKWRENVPNFRKVRIKEVYSGIDVVYYGDNSTMKYDLIVKPGGNPKNIMFAYDFGSEAVGQKLRKNSNDELELTTPFGTLKEKRPYCYQVINGQKIEIGGRYILSGIDTNNLTFEIDTYNPLYELVIDPVLDYSSFLGDSGPIFSQDICVDDYGCTYVLASSSYYYNVIRKFNSTGSAYEYYTWLGSFSYGWPARIVIDSSRNVYICGSTSSTTFPTTGGAYDTSYNGGAWDTFAAKLNCNGGLTYSTYLGGNDDDYTGDIAIDSSGNAYIAGTTASSDFPTTNSAVITNYSGFVTKLNNDGSDIVYSHIATGDTYHIVNQCIDVDNLGNAFVAGYTNHPTIFGMIGSYQSINNNNFNGAFYYKLNSPGTDILYSTYFDGNTGSGVPEKIHISSSGLVTMSGTCSGSFMGKPYKTLTEGYVVRFNSSNALVFSSRFGGTNSESLHSMTIDSGGNTWVTGVTSSTDFPTTTGAYDTSQNGSEDAFITKINTSGNIAYSTYIGGTAFDEGWGIATDPFGEIYLTGLTYSSTVPTTAGARDTSYNGNGDTFVTKFTNNQVYYGSIAGTIYDLRTSQVVSGATVTLLPQNINTTSDGSGHYIFENVRALSGYGISAVKSGYLSATQTNITVSNGDTTTVDVSINQYGSITGRITDSSTGAGLSNTGIYVTPGTFNTNTDSNGYYTVPYIPVDMGYTVTASRNFYFEGSQNNVSVTAGTAITVNLALVSSLGSMSGMVTDSLTDEGIQDATVTVLPGGWTATTDSTGSYSIPSIPDGNYSASASASNYTTSTPDFVSITVGINTVHNIALASSVNGLLSGTITDSVTSQPLEGATVILLPDSLNAVTDTLGVYAIQNIPAGTGKTVNVSKSEYLDDSRSSVVINTGSTTYVNLAMTPIPRGTLAGTISHSGTGQPVQSVIVTVSPGAYADTTDVYGDYSIPDILEGLGYEVTAAVADSSFLTTVSDSVEVVGDTTNTLDLVVSPAPDSTSIAGQVTDADTGAPIESVQVTVLPDSLMSETDENGNYMVQDVPAGAGKTVAFSSFAYQDTTVTGVEKVAGVTTDLTLVRPATPTGRFAGHITYTDTTGVIKYAKNAKIKIFHVRGGDILYTIYSQSDDGNPGYYTTPNLPVKPAGENYQIIVEGPEGWTRGDVARNPLADEVTELNIDLGILVTNNLTGQFDSLNGSTILPTGTMTYDINRNYFYRFSHKDSNNKNVYKVWTDTEITTFFNTLFAEYDSVFASIGYDLNLEVGNIINDNAQADDHLIYVNKDFTSFKGRGNHEKDTSTNILTNASVELGNFSWSNTTGTTSPHEEDWDLYTIALHELGHSLELGHCEWFHKNIMRQSPGDIAFPGDMGDRFLGPGDKAGLAAFADYVPEGTIPFTMGLGVIIEDSLYADIFVPESDSLLIFDNYESSVLYLNNFDITTSRDGDSNIFIDSNIEISPDIRLFDSNGIMKGLFHSLYAAVDSVATGDSLYVGSDVLVTAGSTLTIPDNAKIAFAQDIQVSYEFSASDPGSLEIGSNVSFKRASSLPWSGITVNNDGALTFNGACTFEGARTALTIQSSDVTCSYNTITFKDCNPTTLNGVVYIDNCSPTLRYLYIHNSGTANSGDDCIYVEGSSSYPLFYNLTLSDYGSGIYMFDTTDALMRDSVLHQLQNPCIILESDDTSDSATIDLEQGQSDITPASGEYAIDNENGINSFSARNNYWDGSNPIVPSTLFADPSKIDYSFYQTVPYNLGALKRAVVESDNPFQRAADYELAGKYDDALDIYYSIISTSKEYSHKRRAIKAILKISDIDKRNYKKIRDVISNELNTDNPAYKRILEFILCEILFKEKRYDEAISRFENKSSEFTDSHMEVEMLSRIAQIYGWVYKDKENVKKYADKIAMKNPGEPILNSIYQMAGVKYESSNYEDKFREKKINKPASNGASNNENEITEDIEPSISINPNPANPMTTISYTLNKAGYVKLDVYSINGQKVAEVVNEYSMPGKYSTVFNGSNLGSGIYLYRFNSPGFNKNGKILLIK